LTANEPDQQRRLIGEEFYQIDVPSNSTREGYGLGLSIVGRLTKLLGLELQVRSELGKGSVFSIRLRQSARTPALEPASVAAGSAHQEQARALDASILLVEDDSDVRNATRMLLKTEGYEVMTAASLAETLQRLRESRNTDLTDFHLAAGNLRRIRICGS